MSFSVDKYNTYGSFSHAKTKTAFVSGRLGFLQRNLGNCPHKVKAGIYFIYIKPILVYVLYQFGYLTLDA